MRFGLFVLLNAILFIRPEEIYPDIEGLRLYLIVISICTFLSLPRLFELFSPESLRYRPVAVCILLFFASTMISMAFHGQSKDATEEFGPEFAKVILYYFLLIANVDTQERFKTFIAWLVVFIIAFAAIALSHFHGLADLSLSKIVQNEFDPVTGESFQILRMAGSGIFSDPNDLCLALGLGIVSCIYLATGALSRAGAMWFLPIPLFIFGMVETQSRGGLFGILAGCGAYLFSRFGGPKSLPYVITAGIVILMLIGGRQGDVSGGGGESDTAHQRLMFWAEGFSELGRRPFCLPIGLGKGWFLNEVAHVAHNSFIEAYVEFGILGGGAFLGAFAIAGIILYRFGCGIEVPAWVLDARHFGLAALFGFGIGSFSLTRNYVAPTYLVLGLASVLLDQAAENLPEKFQVNRNWFIRGILFSIAGLLILKFATQGMCLIGI